MLHRPAIEVSELHPDEEKADAPSEVVILEDLPVIELLALSDFIRDLREVVHLTDRVEQKHSRVGCEILVHRLSELGRVV